MTLVLLCGLPASGKSTLAQALYQQYTESQHAVTYICFDALWQQMFCHSQQQFDSHEYKQAQQKMYEQVHEWCAIAKLKNTILLVDDNFYYTSMRHEYVQLARKHELSCCIIYCTCELQICLARNAQRQVPVPPHKIEEMACKFEPLQAAQWKEHFTAPGMLHLQTDVYDLPTCLQQAKVVIEAAPQLINHQQIAAQSRIETSNNEQHQADVQLRKQVSQLVQQCKHSNKQQFAQALNAERKALLVQIHDKKISLQDAICALKNKAILLS